MPERREILERAISLQSHIPFEDRNPEGDEVWSGTGHRARFSLSRTGATLGDQIVEQLWLTLKGSKVGQDVLKSEFVSVLGDPGVEIKARRFGPPHMVVWDASVLDRNP